MLLFAKAYYQVRKSSGTSADKGGYPKGKLEHHTIRYLNAAILILRLKHAHSSTANVHEHYKHNFMSYLHEKCTRAMPSTTKSDHRQEAECSAKNGDNSRIHGRVG